MENNRGPLDDIAAARAAAADRLVSPWWYHPALGLLVAGLHLAIVLGSTAVLAAALGGFAFGVTVLVSAYRKRSGVWVSGFAAGPASRWAYTLAATIAVVFIGSWILHRSTGLVWPSVIAAVVLFGAVIALGHRFDVSLREQLRQR